jgi:hypothetical protein
VVRPPQKNVQEFEKELKEEMKDDDDEPKKIADK